MGGGASKKDGGEDAVPALERSNSTASNGGRDRGDSVARTREGFDDSSLASGPSRPS